MQAARVAKASIHATLWSRASSDQASGWLHLRVIQSPVLHQEFQMLRVETWEVLHPQCRQHLPGPCSPTTGPCGPFEETGFVAEHGGSKLGGSTGTQLVAECDRPVQLKGMTVFNPGAFGECVCPDSIATMVNN